MCKVLVRNWNNLKSTHAAEMLKGDFPKCGVKFTGKHSQGLVLARYDVPIQTVREKAKAAHSDITNVFIIPKPVAEVYGMNIPVLVDVVKGAE